MTKDFKNSNRLPEAGNTHNYGTLLILPFRLSHYSGPSQKLKNQILRSAYKKVPTKALRTYFQPELIKDIDRLNRVKYWNNLAIGYSFIGRERDSVRLELRATSSSNALGVAKKLLKELGDDANLRVVKLPIINTTENEETSHERECGELKEKSESLILGSSIGSMSGGTGTLGGFGIDLNDEINLISCYHVIGGIPGSKEIPPGESVYHPGPKDDRPKASNLVAALREYPVIGESILNQTDSASAKLLPGIKHEGNVVPRGFGFKFEGEQILELPEELRFQIKKVYKIGKSSCMTEGTVTAQSIDKFSIRIETEDKEAKFIFDNIIEVTWLDDNDFASKGDSGSCVFTEINGNLYAVGLLFASGSVKDLGDSYYKNASYACTMKNVLSENGLRWHD